MKLRHSFFIINRAIIVTKAKYNCVVLRIVLGSVMLDFELRIIVVY